MIEILHDLTYQNIPNSKENGGIACIRSCSIYIISSRALAFHLLSEVPQQWPQTDAPLRARGPRELLRAQGL